MSRGEILEGSTVDPPHNEILMRDMSSFSPLLLLARSRFLVVFGKNEASLQFGPVNPAFIDGGLYEKHKLGRCFDTQYCNWTWNAGMGAGQDGFCGTPEDAE